VKFAAGAAAVGFAALAQALGQGAAEKPAIECEASKLGAKVSLGSGELGTMEVIAHIRAILYLIYIIYTRYDPAKQSKNECEFAPAKAEDQKTNRIRWLSWL
jgi:hypothetical protein